jgi:ParB-like chromosome segregation protein Spo0J
VNVWFHEHSLPHLVDIENIRPNPHNENCNETDEIVASIATNGFYGTIIADADGMIVNGHGRYAALQELGATQIPVMYAETNAEESARIRVGDNRTTRLGRDDPALLLETLAELQETEIGLIGTGYGDEDVDELRASIENPLEFDDAEFAKQRGTKIFECPNCGWTPGQDG